MWPSEGLKASVAARSFKGELIVIGESRVNPFMQVWGGMSGGRLGWYNGFPHSLLELSFDDASELSHPQLRSL